MAAFKLLAAMVLLWTPTVLGVPLDVVVFGDTSSEESHGLIANLSETFTGSLTQPARRLLPKNPLEVNGGDLTFTVAVDPVRRNYFSLKLWGGDDTNDDLGRLYLYVPLDGVNYQVGYRHEGDYLPLSVAADKPPLPGRFFYSTTLLPLWMTLGKTALTVRIVSTGRLYGLGSGYEGSGGNYQFNMKMPSRGIYRAYTHTVPMLDVSGEAQGAAPVVTTRPEVIDTSILGSSGTYTAGLNAWVNGRLAAATTDFNTIYVELLAKAYQTPQVTAANNNSAVVAKVVAVIDDFVRCYYAQPTLAFTKATYLTADGFPLQYTESGGNEVWGGRFGPLGRAIALLKDPLASYLDVIVDYGSGVTKTRRQAWAEALRASLDFGRLNRRTITNQSILGDGHIYKANMGLVALGSSLALAETAAQRYLKEACGLLPWQGSDLSSGGSELRYGSSYYQVTPKGMTREWGYVGSYGEMSRHVATFYELTGNPEFLAQSVKMTKARAPFRRPAIEVSGTNNYRTMERTGLLAWRAVRETDGEFANEVNYAEPAAWSGGMRVAAFSQDPAVIGYAKQMLAENQYLNGLVSDTRFYRSLTGDALWAFDAFADYAAVKLATDSGVRLPMADSQPDFVWADEVGGVIALKNGNERLWVAPYWQAKLGTGINGIARFHFSTTNYDQYGVFETTPQFKISAYYTRPNYVDKPESLGFVPPDSPRNAYAGEIIPLGAVPSNAQDGAPFIGRADFYAFRFGRYLFGVNASTNPYSLRVPSVGFTSQATTNLVTRTTVSTNSNGTVNVGPTNSVVLYLSSATETNAVPQTPLLVTALGNSIPSIVVDWTPSSGAQTYTVKRSASPGGPYSEINDTEGFSVSTGIVGTTFTDSYVTLGASFYYVVSATNANGSSYDSMEAFASAGLPLPWTAMDVGAVTVAGFSSLQGKVFTLRGSGSDVGGTADSFYFVSMGNSGDGTLIARLATRTQGGSLNDKMGLMIRQDNATSGSPMFSVYFDGGSNPDKAKVSYRTSAGGTTTVLYGDQKNLPQWLKVTRSGNTYTGSISSDGATWTTVGSASFTMSGTLQFGMFVCSRDAAALNFSTFDGVKAPNGWGYPPDVPAGLNAVSGPGTAGLSWTSVAGAGQYFIKRATVAGGPYAAVGQTTMTSYTDAGLTNGVTYHYVVSALNPNGESGNSSEVQITPLLSAPSAPTGLSAAAGNASVVLNWNASYQATGYNLKRSASSSGPFIPIALEINTTSHTDSSVANGNTYYYLVTATGPGGESANSVIVPATPSAVSPAPVGLQALAGNNSALLVWPTSLGALTYNLKRAISPVGPFTTVAAGLGATGFTDTSLTNGTAYYYVLSAINAAGESPNSAPVSVIPTVTVLPTPYMYQDIGAVGIKGASSVSGTSFTVVASGGDIWDAADGFGFLYVPVNGDCTITAKVTALQNIHVSSKGGVMIRETLASNSKYAMAAMTPGSGLIFEYRNTTGGISAQANSSSRSVPYWVRLVRSGNTLTAFRSSSGSNWRNMGSVTVSMSARVYVGLAVTSHDNTKTATASFDNFIVSTSGTLGAPTKLSATASSDSVTLAWTALTGAASYNIQRSTSLDGPYVTIATGVSVTSYVDDTVINDGMYFYRVSGSSSAGEGWPSAAVAAIPRSWVPAGLSAIAGNGQVLLSWSAVANAEGYRAWRSTNSDGLYAPVGDVATTGFLDSAATNGMRYFYQVTAMRGGIEGEKSAVVSAIPQSASTGLAGTWANRSVTTNSQRYTFMTTSGNTNIGVIDSAGGPHAVSVGDMISPLFAVAGLGARFCYWVVSTSSNGVSISITPGGPPITPTATSSNTNALRASQRWSVGSNWSNNIIPSGADAVATFPRGSLPLDVGVVVVDSDVILGKLVYTNASNFSDCTVVSTLTNTMRFAVSGTNPSLARPMIEVPAASQKWLQLGDLASNTNGTALRIAGSQGLVLRASAGGTVSNAVGSNPAKDLSIQNVDWTGFSGGLVVDRGSIGLATNNRLPPQTLILGTEFSASNNVLAGLKMQGSQTLAGFSGNAMGRIFGAGTLIVGTNHEGGDFAGIVGQQFNGIRDSNSLRKIGTNRQVISGTMVGNGSVDVAGGLLIFAGSGTNTLSGAVTVSNGATLCMDAAHLAMASFTNLVLAGISGSSNFVVTNGVALKNDDVVCVTATNAGLQLATDYYVIGTPAASTNVQLATNRGGTNFVATASGNATVQFSSTTNGYAGFYAIANGGKLSGGGRLSPWDTVGGSNAAIVVAGTLAPGPVDSAAYGTMTFDGLRCSRKLLSFETNASFTFQVAASTNDAVVITNAQTGDVSFNSNVLNFMDASDGTLPLQTVLFSSDAPCYSGLSTNPQGMITNGMRIGAGLEAYPQAALYLLSNNIVLRLVPPPPPAPVSLSAVGGDRQISLSWPVAAGVTNYSVYRSSSMDGLFDAIALRLAATNFTDADLAPATTYFYQVRSLGETVESGDYAAASAATTATLKQLWRIQYFGAVDGSSESADGADPDSDGRPNLMEYALGSDPKIAEFTPPAVLSMATNGPRLCLTFNRVADEDLVYTVLGTDSLEGTNPWTHSIWTSTGVSNTAGPVTVPDTFTIPEKNRRFLRLKIQ